MIDPKFDWFAMSGKETIERGFSALCGGTRSTGSDFYLLKDNGHWWTSDKISMFEYGYIYISPDIYFEDASHVNKGKSVRCVKD